MPAFLVSLILALPLVGAYAMYATGIVVIYQSSRVINLAHGAMATVPAYLFQVMVVRWGVPMVVALPLCIAAGAALGAGIERAFVRRLRPAGVTAQTVGTVAAFGLIVAVVAKVFGTGAIRPATVFPQGHIEVGASILRYGQIGLFAVAIASALILQQVLRRTWVGLGMRGAAENRQASSLMGIDPDRSAAAAWALGGGLAATAGILLAAVTVLSPYSLSLSVLPAFVAALIGGLGSLTGTLAGAGIVGAVLGLVPTLAKIPGFHVVLGQTGGAELSLAVVALIAMAARGARLSAAGPPGAIARTPPSRPMRFRPRLLVPLLIAWVFIPGVPFSVLGDANQALFFAMVALSVVLLTGWVGQISLAQAAFVGVGGFSTALLSRRLGIGFPFSLPLAGAIAAAAAVLLGLVALRVRGLYLAVATLIFGWMADNYLFTAPWFAGSGGSATAKSAPIGRPGGFPYFDFTDRRVLYLVGLAGAGLAVLLLANVRRSKTGRAFFAVRGSETAAASLGIDVTRYKLLAFAVSGAMAGVAGNILTVGQQTIVPAQFAFTISLLFLSIAVVGGLRSTGGAIGSAVVFSLLNELFLRVDAFTGYLEVVSAGLLAAALLFYPEGLAAVPHTVRGWMQSWSDRAAARRMLAGRERRWGRMLTSQLRGLRGEARDVAIDLSRFWSRLERLPGAGFVAKAARGLAREIKGAAREIGSAIRSVRARATRRARRQLHVGAFRGEPVVVSNGGAADVLVTDGVTVKFGGLLAVDDAALHVRRGEIVGLIGPNGAGKTTLFNAIAGFVQPVSGRVLLHGHDITSMPVHDRAARGIGRTFQVVQLFGGLSVGENLLVATHGSNPSGFGSHVAVTAKAVRAERDASERVHEVARAVGIEHVLDRPVDGLPFGTLRLIEVARALVTQAPLIMLDEPASGLDNRETDRLAKLLRRIRDEFGTTILLIEHDIRMVAAVSDRVYVIDAGVLIASGDPATVLNDPEVLAAYLGETPLQQPA